MKHYSQAMCALLSLSFASGINRMLGGVHGRKLDEVWVQFVEHSRLLTDGSKLAPVFIEIQDAIQDSIRSGKPLRR
jgi:hypothetical protein